jgi:hypothetical protein
MTVIQVCGINSFVCTPATSLLYLQSIMYAYVTDTTRGSDTYIFNATLKAKFSATVYRAERIVKGILTERKSHGIDSSGGVNGAETSGSSVTRCSIGTGGNKS